MYTVIVEEVRVMAKMGRPKSDNPKEHRVTVRFTDTEYQRMKERAAKNNQTITQMIRKCLTEVIETR